MTFKNSLIAGLLAVGIFSALPEGAEAQTVRAQVCTAAAEFVVDRRQFITSDIRAIRATLRGSDDLTTAERNALRREVVQLRARRQMLKIAERRLGRFAINQGRQTASGAPSVAECRSLNVYTTRVASYS